MCDGIRCISKRKERCAIEIGLVSRSGDDADVVRHGLAVTAKRLTVGLVKKYIIELDGHFVISLPPLGKVLSHRDHCRSVKQGKSIKIRMKLLNLFRFPTHGL
ncbi:hypothetical protein GCM10007901_23660 [Dyella acidisoli]|uniref:Uncharacterized protein n=1 Tax=Dyella acidisoli TaxID=1867834 RepID=A0ABQ5XNW9_9GAMM|nr:hypothetical protein GCM10007901_23660 [Dyella acidisoli]